jgi:hypothetical protein
VYTKPKTEKTVYTTKPDVNEKVPENTGVKVATKEKVEAVKSLIKTYGCGCKKTDCVICPTHKRY